MLSKKLWDKIKKKLVELSAELRLRELKVLKVQTSDREILKEIKDLIEKAELELRSLPWRERGGAISLGSRVKFVEEEFTREAPRALEEAVADIPAPAELEEKEVEIKYAGAGEYASKEGYFSSGYKGPTSVFEKRAEEEREVKTAREITESFGEVSPSEYTKRLTKR